ncbi:MAG: hypothetical protein JZD41_06500 [Thermoproteus sp.]|nr:hypothetical protein [Thermoproteus sp.]
MVATRTAKRARHLGAGLALLAAAPFLAAAAHAYGLQPEGQCAFQLSVRTPFNKTSVWINASASYAPPASAISTDGVRPIPAHLTIDGRRAPLAPVRVNAP